MGQQGLQPTLRLVLFGASFQQVLTCANHTPWRTGNRDDMLGV